MEPSGLSYRHLATAIGKGKNAAKSALEKLDLSTITCREAVRVAFTRDASSWCPQLYVMPFTHDTSSLGPQLHTLALHALYILMGATLREGEMALSSVLASQVIECAKILYMGHDPAKDKPIELELSWVCDQTQRMHQLVPSALKAEAEESAKAARAAMDE